MEYQTICNELSTVINIFRHIYRSNAKVLNMIDEDYEAVLLNELNLIPTEFLKYIVSYINLIKLLISSFNLEHFTSEVLKMTSKDNSSLFPQFTVDTYEVFCNGLNKITLSAKDKARIKNMSVKFKPLFTCLDGIINEPVDKLVSLNSLFNDKYSGLL